MTVRDLPSVNAALNLLSFLLLLTGWVLVKQRRLVAHRRVMKAALASSGLFLVSYVVYHLEVGSVRFQGQGPVRTVYFTILLTHTVLAVVIVPLVLITVVRAQRGQFERHRRIARVTLPLWAYVSVTGVAVYWMLYRMAHWNQP
jgi:uncharacterized membrane protein YozB (DUF420 family)